VATIREGSSDYYCSFGAEEADSYVRLIEMTERESICGRDRTAQLDELLYSPIAVELSKDPEGAACGYREDGPSFEKCALHE
jgi:hypothetical protein